MSTTSQIIVFAARSMLVSAIALAPACKSKLSVKKAEKKERVEPADPSFTIEEVSTHLTDLDVVWNEIDGAESYDLIIASDTECKNEQLRINGITTTTQEVTISLAGTFYICIFANLPGGETIAAANNGFEISTTYLVVSGSYNATEAVQTTLTANIVNLPSGSSAGYSWTMTSGTSGLAANVAGPTLQITPPEASANYSVTYTLDAYVSGELLQSKNITILVSSDNDLPIANAGSDQSVVEGLQVSLNGSASSDPEGAALTYLWSQVSGPSVSLTGATTVSPTFTAPSVAADDEVVIQLVVNDGTNNSIADSVTIDILNNANLMPSTQRGYYARACGLDMNRDGIIGTSDDCKVCDGVTTDPDGDGDDEDIFYVDRVAGTDSVTCGSPSAPCKEIVYTMNNRLDGPSVGQEDIMCIYGSFDTSMTLAFGGKATSYVRDGFEYPSNPVLIMGWDKDGDGAYPPYDTDDLAEVSAPSGNNFLNAGSKSYIELAHLTLKNISASGVATTGLYIGDTAGSRSHVYIHDVEVDTVNSTVTGGWIVDMGYNRGALTHFALENLKATNIGSGFFRYYGWSYVSQYLRFRNNTVEPIATTSLPQYTFMQIDPASDVGIERNALDVKYSLWTPVRSVFVNLGNCSKRVTISENRALEITSIINAYIDASSCATPATQDDITVSYNYVTNNGSSSAPIVSVGYRAGASSIVATTFEDYNVIGNYFMKMAGSSSSYCISSTIGNDGGANPGTFSVLGNTCIGFGVQFGNTTATYSQNSIVVKNNIFADVTAANIYVQTANTAPTAFVADYNAYTAAGTYRWPSSSVNFATWQTNSGGDAHSVTCSPSFEDASALDYHLQPTDSCAKGVGSADPLLTRDWDGDAYPITGINIGADQH